MFYSSQNLHKQKSTVKYMRIVQFLDFILIKEDHIYSEQIIIYCKAILWTIYVWKCKICSNKLTKQVGPEALGFQIFNLPKPFWSLTFYRIIFAWLSSYISTPIYSFMIDNRWRKSQLRQRVHLEWLLWFLKVTQYFKLYLKG